MQNTMRSMAGTNLRKRDMQVVTLYVGVFRAVKR
jgi:hypothetical protein